MRINGKIITVMNCEEGVEFILTIMGIKKRPSYDDIRKDDSRTELTDLNCVFDVQDDDDLITDFNTFETLVAIKTYILGGGMTIYLDNGSWEVIMKRLSFDKQTIKAILQPFIADEDNEAMSLLFGKISLLVQKFIVQGYKVHIIGGTADIIRRNMQEFNRSGEKLERQRGNSLDPSTMKFNGKAIIIDLRRYKFSDDLEQYVQNESTPIDEKEFLRRLDQLKNSDGGNAAEITDFTPLRSLVSSAISVGFIRLTIYVEYEIWTKMLDRISFDKQTVEAILQPPMGAAGGGDLDKRLGAICALMKELIVQGYRVHITGGSDAIFNDNMNLYHKVKPLLSQNGFEKCLDADTIEYNGKIIEINFHESSDLSKTSMRVAHCAF